MALKYKINRRARVATVQRKSVALTQNEPEQIAHSASVLQRMPPAGLRPADVLSLQRTVGNRVVQRILRSRIDEERPLRAHSISRRETGLPDNLKAGIESLSGLSLDDVKVHYNSSEPAKLQARAFTQGTDIFLGPNQEEHLAHEAWHVVQQRQGRVRATVQLKPTGLSVNDDASLEKEADVMGSHAQWGTEKEKSDKTPDWFKAIPGGLRKLLEENQRAPMTSRFLTAYRALSDFEDYMRH